MNIDIKRGFLCEDAQVFPTRTGRPKICFRLRVPRDTRLPRKIPVNADFLSVVAYGDKHLSVLPRLMAGREVMTIGVTQSRDMPDGRVVTEILAQEIIVFPDEHEGHDRADLAQFLAAELEAARRQGRPDPESVEEVGEWLAGKLRERIGGGGEDDGD